jgi:hypothetical protein
VTYPICRCGSDWLPACGADSFDSVLPIEMCEPGLVSNVEVRTSARFERLERTPAWRVPGSACPGGRPTDRSVVTVLSHARGVTTTLWRKPNDRARHFANFLGVSSYR